VVANDNNRQSVRVRGNGNVVGSNNVVNSRREEHHHHHHHHGGTSKGGNSGDDATGIGFGILGAALVISWFFVRHAEDIYFYIKLGALISAAPFVVILFLAFFRNPFDNKQLVATVFGFTLSAITFFLAQYSQDSLDPRLIQFSQQARDALSFWKGLTEHGQYVVIGSLASAICLGATIFFSLLMGTFVLWHFLSDADFEDSFLLRALNPFRPSRGGIFAIFLILTALAFESGFVFEILKPTAIR